MKRFALYVAILSAIFLLPKLYAQEGAKKVSPLKGAKCPISGAAVKEAEFVDYNEGKVYFCCGNCKAKFDAEKNATKANLQLVSTKQFKQTNCPLSGGKLNKEENTKVAGVEVAFCCGNCKGKVADLEGDAALDKVFGAESFKKGFKIVKVAQEAKPKPANPLKAAKCPISGAAVKEAEFVDYKEGKVYFCCGNCKGKFDAEKNATKANLQLVSTKQFRQTACPLSGGKLNKEESTKVAGVNVAFCCGDCKGKIEDLEDDAALDRVFGEAAFKKGFKVAKAKKAD